MNIAILVPPSPGPLPPTAPGMAVCGIPIPPSPGPLPPTAPGRFEVAGIPIPPSPGPLFSLGILGSGGPGGSVMPLLKLGQGPRAAALGEAYVSIADDASAVFWNPAGLGLQSGSRFAFSHHQWFLNSRDEVLHAALPAGTGAVGLGLVYSGEPGIQHWDENNVAGDTFATWSGVFTAGYGARVGDRYWVGGTVKGLYENLRDVGGGGAAFDLGFMTRPVPALGLGVVGRNLGVMVFERELELLPLELAVGASFEYWLLKATADVVLPRDNNVNGRFGLEFSPVSLLAVRLGYRSGPVDLGSLGLLSGLTAGLGVRARNLDIDYSFTPYGKLGTAHRLGLQVSLARRGISSLRFKVLDARTLNPVKADLYFTGLYRGAGTADRFGEYRLERLPGGLLIVRAVRTGYVPRLESVYVRELDLDQQTTIVLQSVLDGCVWGTLLDAKTGRPITGTVSYLGPANGSIAVDGDRGSFAFRALPAGSYVFTATAGRAAPPVPVQESVAGIPPPRRSGHAPQSCTLVVTAGRLVQHDFRLAAPAAPPGYQSVLFQSGRAEVGPESDAAIAAVAQALSANPAMEIEIAGHADGFEMEFPGFTSRQALSLARAEAVRKVLVSRFGADPARLTARGYDETRALAASDTPEGQAKNRCAEFIVTRQ